GEERAEQVRRGTLEAFDQRLGARDVGRDCLADHGLEELLLALKVQVDGPLADPGDGRDVVEPRRRESTVGEELERRGNDPRRPRLLPSLPSPGTRCRHITDW